MKKLTYPLAVAAVFSLLFWCLPSYYRTSEALQKVSLGTRDMFFKIRRVASDLPPRAREIVIVSIDEESCARLDARWPWPRRAFASMIRHLDDKGARVIGLNVSFTGREDGDDASSRALARALADHGNAVIGATFDTAGNLVKPSPLVSESARYGYLEKIVDPDFTIRRSYLLRPYALRHVGASPVQSDENFESSFPLEILAAYAGKEAGRPRFDSDLGLLAVGRPRVGVTLDADGSYPLNYLAAEADFARIPAWRVVEGRIGQDEVKGKTVLVGLTSSVLSDTHPTPLGIMPGIVIHANEFLAISSGRVLRFIPDVVTFFVSWIAGLCVLALFLSGRFWLGALGFVLASAGLFLGAQQGFARDFVMEPFVLLLGPLLAAPAGLLANMLTLFMENKGLETRAIHDKMTGLYKYEYLRECLEEEWRRCKRGNLPLSIVMTDLDRFKRINDALGHEAGNDMIRKVGGVIKESARRYDIVSRYGGDEFVILLWHATLTEAKAYRERLREMYHAMAAQLEDPVLKDSSISIGVASFDPGVNAGYPPDPQRLIEDADKDLFLDKRSRQKPTQ